MRIYGGEEELSTATMRRVLPLHPHVICPTPPAPGVGAGYRGVAATPLPASVYHTEEPVLADAKNVPVVEGDTRALDALTDLS